VTRLVVLLVLVGAFAPAAVLGALPLVLLTMVSIGAAMAAVVLARPQPAPAPSAPAHEPLSRASTTTAQARVR
jgi:hypothetical protein